MTTQSLSNGRTRKRKPAKTAPIHRRTTLQSPDLYENGKRVTQFKTIFERPLASDLQALTRLRALNINSMSPAQAWKALKRLQGMLIEKKLNGKFNN